MCTNTYYRHIHTHTHRTHRDACILPWANNLCSDCIRVLIGHIGTVALDGVCVCCLRRFLSFFLLRWHVTVFTTTTNDDKDNIDCCWKRNVAADCWTNVVCLSVCVCAISKTHLQRHGFAGGCGRNIATPNLFLSRLFSLPIFSLSLCLSHFSQFFMSRSPLCRKWHNTSATRTRFTIWRLGECVCMCLRFSIFASYSQKRKTLTLLAVHCTKCFRSVSSYF